MFFEKRRYHVVTIDDPILLAEKLTQHTWCGCTAFQHKDLLFVNDSSSPGGAQEYAVIAHGRLIESITFGWCSEAKALGYIERLVSGELRGDYGAVNVTVETPAQHGRCGQCA